MFDVGTDCLMRPEAQQMETETQSILLVEDNEELAGILLRHLQMSGYDVVHAADGESALALALGKRFNLIILDIMLPKLSGLDVCEGVRQKNKDVLILMLTSKSEDVDKVVGLELGADDYLTKPFNIAELMARIKALLRRSAKAPASGTAEENALDLIYGDLVIDRNKRRVYLEGKEIELTALEFDLLAFLAERPGRPFNRDQLLEQVWEAANMVTEHSVNSMMRRLRMKIEPNPSDPKYILTVRGVGYRFIERHELD